MINCVVPQPKTGIYRKGRELVVANPLVAGSRPARPTSEHIFKRLTDVLIDTQPTGSESTSCRSRTVASGQRSRRSVNAATASWPSVATVSPSSSGWFSMNCLTYAREPWADESAKLA
jgi:hypothetical protein